MSDLEIKKILFGLGFRWFHELRHEERFFIVDGVEIIVVAEHTPVYASTHNFGFNSGMIDDYCYIYSKTNDPAMWGYVRFEGSKNFWREDQYVVSHLSIEELLQSSRRKKLEIIKIFSQ